MSSDFREEPQTAFPVALCLFVMFIWSIAQLFMISNMQRDIRNMEQRIEQLEKH